MRCCKAQSRTLAITAEHSHSGYNAVRYHLLRYRTPLHRNLYAATFGPLVTPRQALEAVLDASADVNETTAIVYDAKRGGRNRTVPSLADLIPA